MKHESEVTIRPKAPGHPKPPPYGPERHQMLADRFLATPPLAYFPSKTTVRHPSPGHRAHILKDHLQTLLVRARLSILRTNHLTTLTGNGSQCHMTAPRHISTDLKTSTSGIREAKNSAPDDAPTTHDARRTTITTPPPNQGAAANRSAP